MPKVTVEQHRLMAERGVAFRPSDGQWGFKRKCANPECDVVIDHVCYCADDVETALFEVTIRSAYPCSYRCMVNARQSDLDSAFAETGRDYFQIVGGKVLDKTIRAIGAALEAGDYDRLTERQRDLFHDWLADETQNWDHDEDDGECSCEL